MDRVPVTIVTGFLGSGKTTLINYLLTEVGAREKLAIIKNEIGDVAVDSKIIKGKNIVMKELLNGCVCCTLVGELEDSLKELVDTVKPDRIIIEASGAANPAILAVNLDRLPFVKRDLIVTLIDAVHFEGYKDKSIVMKMQQKFTDLIVVNRVEEVDEDKLEHVLDDIYEIRPGVPVVKTASGRVDAEILFGVLPKHGTVKILGMDDHGRLHGDHLHEDEIEYFSFKEPGKLSQSCLEKILGALSEEYYRVKGFVWLGNPEKLHLVNFVCGKYEIKPLAGNESISKPQNSLAFIGKRVLRYREKVLERMRGCMI